MAHAPFTLVVAMVVFCILGQASPAVAADRATSATAAKAELDLRKHPTGGKTPVEIAVGMYVTNLAAIDETRENFEVGGYLFVQWHDPRLALPAVGPPHDLSRFWMRFSL